MCNMEISLHITVCTQVKHPTTALLLHDGEICVRFFKPNVETKCALPGWHDKVEISAFLLCHLKCECSSGSGSGSGRGWLLLMQEWHRWKALQKLALWKAFWCNAKRSMEICFIIQIIINITMLMESWLHKGQFVTSWYRIPSCTISIVNLYLSGAQVHDFRCYMCFMFGNYRWVREQVWWLIQVTVLTEQVALRSVETITFPEKITNRFTNGRHRL